MRRNKLFPLTILLFSAVLLASCSSSTSHNRPKTYLEKNQWERSADKCRYMANDLSLKAHYISTAIKAKDLRAYSHRLQNYIHSCDNWDKKKSSCLSDMLHYSPDVKHDNRVVKDLEERCRLARRQLVKVKNKDPATLKLFQK